VEEKAESTAEMAIGRGMEALEPCRLPADRSLVRAVLRREGGFGLVELLISMTMLNIGLLAVVAAFSSGIVSLNRASRTTTAAVLADGQMELYRAIKWSAIQLDASTIPNSAPYNIDTAYSASQVTGTCTGSPPECNAARQATGPDNKSYRIDTYIVSVTPTGGRPVKKVTVVVRDYNNLTVTYARQISTFDQSTGQ
jgi:type II secretory pathway pseudopilin PulG